MVFSLVSWLWQHLTRTLEHIMFSYFIIFCKLYVSLAVPRSSYKPNFVLLLNKISQVHHCTGLPQYTDLSQVESIPLVGVKMLRFLYFLWLPDVLPFVLESKERLIIGILCKQGESSNVRWSFSAQNNSCFIKLWWLGRNLASMKPLSFQKQLLSYIPFINIILTISTNFAFVHISYQKDYTFVWCVLMLYRELQGRLKQLELSMLKWICKASLKYITYGITEYWGRGRLR